jgi:hypothetical protein
MPSNAFRFDEIWELAGAGVEDAYDVLAHRELLPRRWKGVYLQAHKLSDNKEPTVGDRLRVRARGFLPYELNFPMSSTSSSRLWSSTPAGGSW